MKKLRLLFCLCSLAILSSCGDEKVFDQNLIVGKWKQGTEYYRYDANHTGVTWDVADDVSEDEAQRFNWEIQDDQLTIVHLMEMGGQIPKTYELLVLDANTLSFKDDYYKTYTFTRVR